MREQVVKITSDLSGTVYEGTDVPQVKVSVNGKSGTRDLTPDESAALSAWVSADAETIPAARDALRALFSPAAPAADKPARKSGKSGSKGADPRNTAIREWAVTPEGKRAGETAKLAPMNTRGRMPKGWEALYDQAHANGSAAPAASPAPDAKAPALATA